MKKRNSNSNNYYISSGFLKKVHKCEFFETPEHN